MIDDTETPKNSLIILIAIIPGLYFLCAQGAKRCHDRGNSDPFASAQISDVNMDNWTVVEPIDDVDEGA